MEENKLGAPCKVRITGCSTKTWWYNNMIGEEFYTDNASSRYDFVVWEDYMKGKNHTWRHIKQEDCIIIERNGQKTKHS